MCVLCVCVYVCALCMMCALCGHMCGMYGRYMVCDMCMLTVSAGRDGFSLSSTFQISHKDLPFFDFNCF